MFGRYHVTQIIITYPKRTGTYTTLYDHETTAVQLLSALTPNPTSILLLDDG